MGNITASFPKAAARRMARSWGTNRSGRARVSRMPRRPRAGFSPSSGGSQGVRLSPPRSRVRMVTRRPSMAWAARR